MANNDMIATIQYVEEPQEDYPRVLRIKTQGQSGMLRLRQFLERLAGGHVTVVDLLSEMPAASDRVSRCIWHAVSSAVQRTVALQPLPNGQLSVDWYDTPSRWGDLLERFDDYLAQMDQPLVDGSAAIIEPGPGIACLYPHYDTEYDAVFEAEP